MSNHISPRTHRVAGLRTAVAAFATVLLLGAGTVGAHAAWTATASKNASVGTADLGTDLNSPANLTAVYETTIPATSDGRTATAPITVTNTGSAPLTYSLDITGGNATLNAQIDVQVWQQAGSCNTSTVPAAATLTTGTLAAPPALHSTITAIAAGSSRVYCVRTTLKTTYSATGTTSTTPEITFTGRVGANWSVAESGTFTQSASMQKLWLGQQDLGTGRHCLSWNGTAATVSAAACSITTNSDLILVPTGSSYRIFTTGSGTKSLGVAADSTTIAGFTSTGTEQLWNIVQHGNEPSAFLLVNVKFGTCLQATYGPASSVVAPSSAPCTSITDYAQPGYNNQHFITIVQS